jgi:type III pantothenate kinase
MHRLCIDIGNSFIKAVEFHDNIMKNLFIFSSEETEKCINTIINKDIRPQTIIISTVATTSNAVFKSAFPQSRLIDFSHKTPLPIQLEYQTPTTLGLDRIASAVAGQNRFPQKPVLVIGLGTCIIYDLVVNNTYLGGSISPGLNMRFKALHEFTFRLPLIKGDAFFSLPGKSTQDSIKSGVMFGISSEIDGFIDAYKQNYPELQVILSGGDLNYFDNTLKNSIFASPNIVIEGLNIIATFNELL